MVQADVLTRVQRAVIGPVRQGPPPGIHLRLPPDIWTTSRWPPGSGQIAPSRRHRALNQEGR